LSVKLGKRKMRGASIGRLTLAGNFLDAVGFGLVVRHHLSYITSLSSVGWEDEWPSRVDDSVRSSGSCAFLLPFPVSQWCCRGTEAINLDTYSGGTAQELHLLPFFRNVFLNLFHMNGLSRSSTSTPKNPSISPRLLPNRPESGRLPWSPTMRPEW